MKKIFILLGILLCTVAYAASTTTNYSLYKPAQGDTGWGSMVNTNFDTIDSQMKTNANGIATNASNISGLSDTTCDGTSCNVTNTGTLDGYEASALLDNTDDQICSEVTGCVTDAFDSITDFTGTLTDTKICTYDSAGGEIDCNSDASGGSDDQTIDVLSLGGTTLSISLEDDGEANQTVDLASLQDGTGTDDQTCAEVSGCVQNALTTVDMSDDTNLTAGRSLTESGDSVEADSELYTGQAGRIAFEDPTATDDFFFNEINVNQTAVSIYCKTLVGTVDLDVQVGGVDINGSDITCTTTGVLDSSLAGTTDLDVGDELKLAITSVASSPTYLMVVVNATKDD